jgi:hypothetical protein
MIIFIVVSLLSSMRFARSHRPQNRKGFTRNGIGPGFLDK